MIEKITFNSYNLVPKIMLNIVSKQELKNVADNVLLEHNIYIPKDVGVDELSKGFTILYDWDRDNYKWVLPVFCYRMSIFDNQSEEIDLFLVHLNKNKKLLVHKNMNGILFCDDKIFGIYDVNYAIRRSYAFTGNTKQRKNMVNLLKSL